MKEFSRAWRAHGSPAEISTFSHHLEVSACTPRLPPPSILQVSACTWSRCVSYLMSSSKSHSHWCLKCNLVSCSACVFFSSCVTLTWRRQKTGVMGETGERGETEQKGQWTSFRHCAHSKRFESSAVSCTCLTAMRFYY